MKYYYWRSINHCDAPCTSGIDLLSFPQVVESGGRNLEIAVMTQKYGVRNLEKTEIEGKKAG
jgi:hypothetical protein